MAKGIQIQLIGDKEVKELFRKLGAVEEKDKIKILKSALRVAGRTVIKTARARVPVIEGDLKRSLKQKVIGKRKTGTVVSIIGPDIKKVQYGQKVEDKSPFLQPSLENNTNNIENQLRREIGVKFERWAKKLGKKARV